jgi:hydroxymethylpyrimidine pyrophosphatase-like HAD family hydrolase
MDPSISEADLAAVEAARGWVRRELFPRGFVMQPGKAASISLYHEDTALLQASMDEVRGVFEREGWALRVSSTHLYINCDLAHVSKGTGLDRLIAGAGLEKSRLVGVGDTESDFAIAERVARFGCPGNAREAVKERAAYVSQFEEIEGVLDVIRALV